RRRRWRLSFSSGLERFATTLGSRSNEERKARKASRRRPAYAISKKYETRLCLTSRTSGLDTVSTGSGSDLVSDQYAIFLMILTRIVDQVAIAPCTDCVQEQFGILTQSRV